MRVAVLQCGANAGVPGVHRGRHGELPCDPITNILAAERQQTAKNKRRHMSKKSATKNAAGPPAANPFPLACTTTFARVLIVDNALHGLMVAKALSFATSRS
jgi:hypothetical protein